MAKGNNVAPHSPLEIATCLSLDHKLAMNSNLLGPKSDDVVCLEAEDVRARIENCSKSLIGRLMADRGFSGGTMDAAFGAIWNHPEGLRVKAHGDNVFQFFFNDESDLIRVEKGSPWLFKQFVIHLKRWNASRKIEDEDFTLIPIWVQMWGMPEFCKTKEVARKIGERPSDLEKSLMLLLFQ
ncbi:uncharacterized protein [Arachis hypogaea]|uniref:uncharacterized protein n=1 Tax=Arachis hypogaea TaxID=3818 RepID=UPI000DED1AB8|nr:uncharacterized protein LOC112730144 [Arachis hypogaea]